jgi:predicted cupin superfamily sugar epimerase
VDIQRLIDKLGLSVLPREGGHFAETYRSDESIPAPSLDSRYGRDKSVSTAIYYLLTPDTFSEMHRLISDEVYHFYGGDSVEMLQLRPDGSHNLITLGSDILAGEAVQVVVPRGVWQGSRLKSGGEYALLGTTVAPGFDSSDYEHGDRERLIRDYPDCAGMIRLLTRRLGRRRLT